MTGGVTDSFTWSWGLFSFSRLFHLALICGFVPSLNVFFCIMLVVIPGRTALFWIEEEWIWVRGELIDGLKGVEGNEALVGIYYMSGEYRNKFTVSDMKSTQYSSPLRWSESSLLLHNKNTTIAPMVTSIQLVQHSCMLGVLFDEIKRFPPPQLSP